MFKKGYIFISLCLLLTCFLLLGCTKTEKKREENPSDIQKEDLIDNHEPSENEKDDTEQSDEGESEDTFDLLENYKERNIPSVYTEDNKKESYCNVILNENNQIEYYTYSEEADGDSIWKYTLIENEEEKSASWKREAVSWLNGLQGEISNGRITPFRGEDLNNYAVYIDDMDNPHVVKQNGDSFTEILGLDIRKTDYRQVDVLKNGNIVLADLGRECFVYKQEDGSLLTSFRSGWYESLCVKENQIYITDPTGSSVQHYDAEKQEFKTTVEADFKTDVRVAIDKDDIYVCTKMGIYRAKQNGKEFQKVLDAGTYHFAKDSGVLLKFFVIGDAFYVVYGEDRGAIKKYSPAKEDDIATKSLTIYSMKSNDVILDMISEFQDKYPDTEIIYETGEGSEASVTAADRIRTLNARILAGDGPDILVLDGLPTESYIKKGILADLNPVLGDLKEELLPSILSAYTVEDKIYMLPSRFSIPMFLTSGQDPEVYASLKSFVEYSEAEGGVLPEDYSYFDFLQILYYNYPPEIIEKDKTVNKENLKEFLELVKRLCESEQAIEQTLFTYLEGRGSDIPFVKGDADFSFINIKGGYGLSTYPHAAELRNGELVTNKDIFFPETLLGINALSKNKELISTFIQFAFSYEIQERYIGSSGYQICTKVLDEFANSDLSYLLTGDATTVLRGANQKENEQMIEIVKKACTPFTVDESIWQIIEEESIKYLKENRELTESVDAIASRIQLYLYEQ